MNTISIELLRPNNSNPRFIKESQFNKLVKSIKDFPEMLNLRPIIIDVDNVVIGGNMRLKACIHIGLDKVPVIVFTEEMAKKTNEKRVAAGKKEKTYKQLCDSFIIKDNISSGEWDWDMLANDWNIQNLEDDGLYAMQFPKEDYFPDEKKDSNDDKETKEKKSCNQCGKYLL
jgi:hypothetical protein